MHSDNTPPAPSGQRHTAPNPATDRIGGRLLTNAELRALDLKEHAREARRLAREEKRIRERDEAAAHEARDWNEAVAK